MPEFKYVYCSPIMLNQIISAFEYEEVSFP